MIEGMTILSLWLDSVKENITKYNDTKMKYLTNKCNDWYIHPVSMERVVLIIINIRSQV